MWTSAGQTFSLGYFKKRPERSTCRHHPVPPSRLWGRSQLPGSGGEEPGLHLERSAHGVARFVRQGLSTRKSWWKPRGSAAARGQETSARAQRSSRFPGADPRVRKVTSGGSGSDLWVPPQPERSTFWNCMCPTGSGPGQTVSLHCRWARESAGGPCPANLTPSAVRTQDASVNTHISRW